MISPKSKKALRRLGENLRGARLRRGFTVEDLAERSATSPSTIARLERGDPGVGIGKLVDTLVVLGLVERLADLIDIRNDDLGLALMEVHQPKRGRATAKRKRGASFKGEDPDGVAF